MNALTSRLGITYPIFQAPMAGSQGAKLAIAVSNAGGLGALPCAMLTANAMQTELHAIRKDTLGAINVNFFCHKTPTRDVEREAMWRRKLLPYYQELGIAPSSILEAPPRAPFSAEMAELLSEFEPEVVSFHFGLPARALLDRVKQWDAVVMSTATTVEEALWLEANGADVVIAQGYEAGGHRGMFLTSDLSTQIGTMALVPQIVAAVGIPVVAAGGIATAGGVQAALALGASAVQVGTAFLFCPEASTSPLHRAALNSADATHTAITNVYTGRPARGIVNRAMRELGFMNVDAPAFPLAATAMFPLRAALEEQGNHDFSPLWAGQNASSGRDIGAAELVRELAHIENGAAI